jgi:hypothetical protein
MNAVHLRDGGDHVGAFGFAFGHGCCTKLLYNMAGDPSFRPCRSSAVHGDLGAGVL